MKLVVGVIAVMCACGSHGGEEPQGKAVTEQKPAPPSRALPNVVLPEVKAGLPPAPLDGVPVIVSERAIVIDGTAIVAVADADVDPAEKEGGALGVKITRLAEFARQLLAVQDAHHPGQPRPPMLLAFHPKTTYRLVTSTIFSLKPQARFVLLARTGDTIVGAPIELPSRAPAVRVAAGNVELDSDQLGNKFGPPPPLQLDLIVSATKDKVLLWSISGREGTIAQPKVTVARTNLAALTAALVEIRDRRFVGQTRSDDDKSMVIQLDGSLTAQDLLELIAAVRVAGDATELFPLIRLSSGFE
jgi:hypothetical protein